MHNYHRDGQTKFDGNGGPTPVYQPNSFDGPTDDASYSEPPLKINGDADRYDHRMEIDHFTQAGDLLRLINQGEKGRLIGNIIVAMQGGPRDIQVRQIVHFTKADPEYSGALAKGRGI